MPGKEHKKGEIETLHFENVSNQKKMTLNYYNKFVTHKNKTKKKFGCHKKKTTTTTTETETETNTDAHTHTHVHT